MHQQQSLPGGTGNGVGGATVDVLSACPGVGDSCWTGVADPSCVHKHMENMIIRIVMQFFG